MPWLHVVFRSRLRCTIFAVLVMCMRVRIGVSGDSSLRTLLLVSAFAANVPLRGSPLLKQDQIANLFMLTFVARLAHDEESGE